MSNTQQFSVKGTKDVLKLINLLGKSAAKTLRTELRTVSKDIAAEIKPELPVDKGFLRRSVAVRVIKKKKRYTVGYRVFARPPKQGKYYAMVAAEYGAKRVKIRGVFHPVHRPAPHYFSRAVASARTRLPQTIERVKQALQAQWKAKK
jgi:hypothetical protein